MADEFTVTSALKVPSPSPRRAGKSDIHVQVRDADDNGYRLVIPAEIYTEELAISMAAQQKRLKGMERLNNLLRGKG